MRDRARGFLREPMQDLEATCSEVKIEKGVPMPLQKSKMKDGNYRAAFVTYSGVECLDPTS
jgi:hypothetical protein